MVLNGDIGLRFKWIPACSEVGRKHQQPDIVEIGGEFQIVQFAWGQIDHLSDQQ